MNWRQRRSIRRQERRAAGIRTPMEFPVPQPTTPFSKNVTPVTFEDWQLARKGIGSPIVLKLFRKLGAYKVKPHRGSRGVIWKGNFYWWSEKGYYRRGTVGGPRPPLQHVVWEHYHGQKIPRLHEIFFRDRNRNNFSKSNLQLLSKSEMHRLLERIGEVNSVVLEVRKTFAQTRWTNHSRDSVSVMLKNFSTGESMLVAKLRRKK